MVLSNCAVDAVSVYPTYRKPFDMIFERAKTGGMVGLGGLEPPTSSLSGMRSSHLSYRPKSQTGGAGRDRTGDLLNANQALSQLSYSPI